MNPNPALLPSDTDQAIDHALSTLRDAQPRANLNGRILASLEQRAAHPLPARSRLSVHLALWTATAAGVIAIASLIAMNHHARQPSGLAASSSPRITPHPVVEALAPGGLAAGFSPLNTTADVRRALAQAHGRRTATPAHESCTNSRLRCLNYDAIVINADENTTDLDAQALADFHAPSHPAPPLPLTPEEKLFLRMTRDRNATLVAELNPDVRAKEAAQETTAFKAFFPEPPPLKQPLGDDE